MFEVLNSFFGNIKSKFKAIEYSNIDYLSIKGIPFFTYGLIGITSIVLASITLQEATNDITSSSESMVKSLPSLGNITNTITKTLTPKSSSGTEGSVISNMTTGLSNNISNTIKETTSSLPKVSELNPVEIKQPPPPQNGGKKNKTKYSKKNKKINKTKKI